MDFSKGKSVGGSSERSNYILKHNDVLWTAMQKR